MVDCLHGRRVLGSAQVVLNLRVNLDRVELQAELQKLVHTRPVAIPSKSRANFELSKTTKNPTSEHSFIIWLDYIKIITL